MKILFSIVAVFILVSVTIAKEIVLVTDISVKPTKVGVGQIDSQLMQILDFNFQGNTYLKFEDKIVKKQENTSSISTISDQEMEQKQKKSTISEVKKWSTYNKSNTYSTIPNDYVNSIYQDQLGNMWFATK